MPLVYRFMFVPEVPLIDAEMTLQLALIALEGLHGKASVRLEARYDVDEKGRTISVSGDGLVGDDLVRMYTALVIGEFGENSFSVRK